jgi:metal-responsive CopG/Arc/MetJ family transcriptional regulator
MKEEMTMRTTINISEELVKEAEALYETSNRSKAIESALADAIRYKKLQAFKQLKGKISFDEEFLNNVRSMEMHEEENNS